MDDPAGTYRLGDPVRDAIRCPKNCGRLLINGRSCGCTWHVEPETDPLVGQAALLTDKDGRRILAHGTITTVKRSGDGLDLTVARYPL